MNTKIDTVIFDVGWVLVHLNFQPLLASLQLSPDQFQLKELVAAIDLEAHERGEFGGAVLIDRLHQLTRDVERDHIKRGWLDIFEPQQPMLDLAQALTRNYRVHLLSNVGDLHWAHLNAKYDLRGRVHDALPSFEAGVMKPHPDIYRQAEQRFALVPDQTVFIDDLQPNVQAARARGWHAIQHQSHAATVAALRELGVAC